MNDQPFLPPEDEKELDVFPARPRLRRIAFVIYGLIAICVILGLLATFFPQGDPILPFDPPPPFRRSI